MRKADPLPPAYAGVDTHKDTNMLGLKDALGRAIGTWEFPAGPDGYAALAEAIGDGSVPVGIEGARSYGAGLACYLAERGFEVFEVVRPRREQRRRGKSDAIDALAACDNLSAGRCTTVKLLGGEVESLRWLMVARERAVSAMTQLACCVDSMLVTAPSGLRERWRGSSGAPRMRAIARTRPKDGVGIALREMARAWVGAEKSAASLEERISELVWESFPLLAGAPCVGPITAARIILAAGSNPERMRSEAAFSMLCGTSPIPASSGATDRHRLNRGGDRQANRAIHEIVTARMAHDQRTRAYIERRRSEGKSKREAIRCLCRYVAREVYGLLTAAGEPPCDQSALRGRRLALGITQSALAEGSGATRSKVSRLESGREHDNAALAAMDAFLGDLEKARQTEGDAVP